MTLYLIRGLPGSGKSTMARVLVDIHQMFEADMYFINFKTGAYQYDASKIANAHAYCKIVTEEAMKDKQTPLAVANTFVKRWEMNDYYDLAATYGYTVVEITMSGKLFPSIHNVPEEKIELMKANWER